MGRPTICLQILWRSVASLPTTTLATVSGTVPSLYVCGEPFFFYFFFKFFYKTTPGDFVSPCPDAVASELKVSHADLQLQLMVDRVGTA